MYFKEFPLIQYAFDINNKPTLVIVKDIALNIRIRKEILSNVVLFDEFDLQDGDTPERVADRVYGDPNLNWVIMLCNERFDYSEDFPLSQDQLLDYVKAKYGEANAYTQHQLFGKPHYRSLEGFVVDADYPLAEPISNYDYEFELNESKRTIKIINPKLIDGIVLEIQSLFG